MKISILLFSTSSMLLVGASSVGADQAVNPQRPFGITPSWPSYSVGSPQKSGNSPPYGSSSAPHPGAPSLGTPGASPGYMNAYDPEEDEDDDLELENDEDEDE